MHIPVSRWGEPYKSLDIDKVVHFATGEVLAEVSRANGGLVERDMRFAKRAREVLREIPIKQILQMVKKAGELYAKAELPLGDGAQTPEQFARMQSATTGLPEHMCRFNMEKNEFVLGNMDKILDSLTRGLDLDILSRGYGVEERGVPVSYQSLSPVLGLVLPSNSPGVHTLWLPIIPLQVGLVLKPGPQEPWTPYRMTQAFIQAGIPKQAIAIYPGLGDVGAAVLQHCPKSLIFGGSATVEQYKGNPRVQVHGPGFSKILLGDDQADNWQKYLDIMVDSVFVNSGRGCINCSGIWVTRNAKQIAEAIAERIGPAQPLPPEDPKSALAAFTVPGQADQINAQIDQDVKEEGVHDMTAKFGPRLVKKDRCDYLRPTVILCDSPEKAAAKKEYMFPFVSVVQCPQSEMLEKIGPTLVCSAITEDVKFQRALADAVHIDRLNIGPLKTIALNWLQPHEGSIVDFLFRARAFQLDKGMIRI
ncbi:MAG: aldehyde dehydrogenase family protein [Gemmataceae bacterium]|nr:aldehyde dehydrogenase family protein [Gemmataceae bacterium]MCI0739904.1 aldehyde dehydrogenase family protein [Gemmataceae bacterium]